MSLDTSPRLTDADALFAALAGSHEGLDPAASRRLDAQIVLLLANHIGDVSVVREAIALARSLAPVSSTPDATPDATPDEGDLP